MRFHDISGLIVCAAFYILPFAIILGFALSRIIKSIKYRKKKRLSTQLFNMCGNCASRYLGADDLYHCDVADLGPDICSPKMRWCYREEKIMEDDI